jgi:RimJ/RimL family protein N-acetyltransferase
VIVISQHVAMWVAERTGGQYFDGSGHGIGWVKDDELVAGVLFDNFTGRSVQMHVAAARKNWLSREFMRFCFHYPFEQLKVNKLVGLVDSTNAAALRFDLHLGFQQEAVIKDAGKTGDIIVLTMTREQCRFLGK